jgi:NADPH-dependent curcumin reductase CurA
MSNTPASTKDVRQFRLTSRPEGDIQASDFELVGVPFPTPGDNEFVVKVTHISIDPAMRGWMSDEPSYLPPVKLGDVMRALAVGRVLVSRHGQFSLGQWVHGPFGVTEYAVSNGFGVYPIDVTERLTPSAYLGILGLTGLTAYFGLLQVGRLGEGERVLVSGAAGGVGTAVGQIAKLKGSTAIGIAGGPDKCRLLLEDLGFDGAIDHKRDDFNDQLRELTPDRVDVFFDNVGGEILNQGLTRLRRGARVVICGAISQYNNVVPGAGPSNYMALLVARASMTGFLCSDYMSEYPKSLAELSGWLSDGRVRGVEDSVVGDIELFPSMLDRLFRGQNVGKVVLELAD